MFDLTKPINLASPEFIENKFEIYEQVREQAPVHPIKISVVKGYGVSRYEDCAALLKDPRVVRNRANATGGRRTPFPIPKSLKPMVETMIVEDDPNHRRLRDLVRKGFRPQAISALETRIDDYSNELLDELSTRKRFDLNKDYALKIPVRMIADMMGAPASVMPEFQKGLGVLSDGFSGLRMLRTMFLDLPRTVKFVRSFINTKRDNPGDDILSGLIHAEQDGDRLTEDELVGMVFLVMVAGYETTVHLICNGVLALLQNPDALGQLQADPTLINTAVEEILRHRGPVQSTKPGYATQDLTLQDTHIPKGSLIMPLFAAANHDPREFDNPQTFDITRTPNHHLGFGHGVHFCMGAHLARSEARFGINNLLARMPNLTLAVPEAELTLQTMPGWHRYNEMPITVGA